MLFSYTINKSCVSQIKKNMPGSQNLEGKYYLERIQWNPSSDPLCPVCAGDTAAVSDTQKQCPPLTSHWEPISYPQACAKSWSKLFSHENKLSLWLPFTKTQTCKVPSTPTALCHLTSPAAVPLVARFQVDNLPAIQSCLLFAKSSMTLCYE